MKNNKLMHGWGVNDVDYTVDKRENLPKVNGKRKQKLLWVCPYYQDWKSLLARCLNNKLQDKSPTYKGCTVCEEWKYLSNFIKWVDSQPNRDWKNCELDKDLLMDGNKHYSPETCVYISSKVNSFINTKLSSRGNFMIGVYLRGGCTSKNMYHCQCGNPFSGKQEYIGVYPTELEAHKAWQAKKHEHALRLADLQADWRVADALRQRYAPDKDWTNR